MPDTIELKNITLYYDEEPVLCNISQMIYPSETVCLLGPSGSGKSTLLKVMAGLERPQEGQVLYSNKNLYEIREKQYLEIQKRTSFVFQDGALLSNMDVFNNIALPMRYHFRINEERLQKKISLLLDHFDLNDKIHMRPAKLSIGNRKLVAFARALIIYPEIIFFDDPTANIDPISAEKVFSLIKEKKAEHSITSIIATSDIELATKLADRLFILFNGKILISGTVEEVMACEDPLVLKIIDTISIRNPDVAEEVSKFLL